MLHIKPPKKPKLVVIVTRPLSNSASPMPPELQEEICRRYCSNNGIKVSHSIHLHCNSEEETLDVLRHLVRLLPLEVDTLLAAKFECYSTLIPDLGRLCLIYQCRPTWVYSLDVPKPLYCSLCTIVPEDFSLAESRYQALLRQEPIEPIDPMSDSLLSVKNILDKT